MKCKFETCDKNAEVRGMCRGHYRQWREGLTLKPLRKRKVLHTDENGRVCTECAEYKPWDEFYERPEGRFAICKECFKKQEAKRRLARAASS